MVRGGCQRIATAPPCSATGSSAATATSYASSVGAETEVALLGQRGVHQDERQLPRARLAPLRVPEPVRVRRARAQAGQRGPADARVVERRPASRSSAASRAGSLRR